MRGGRGPKAPAQRAPKVASSILILRINDVPPPRLGALIVSHVSLSRRSADSKAVFASPSWGQQIRGEVSWIRLGAKSFNPGGLIHLGLNAWKEISNPEFTLKSSVFWMPIWTQSVRKRDEIILPPWDAVRKRRNQLPEDIFESGSIINLEKYHPLGGPKCNILHYLKRNRIFECRKVL